MKTDLVKSFRGDLFTNTKVLSEMLEVPHDVVMKTVANLVKKQPSEEMGVNLQSNTVKALKFPQKFKETTYTNKMNRSYKMYELNEQAYMKLAMRLSGYKKADMVQDAIIEAFSMMKYALLNKSNSTWLDEKEKGKVIRLQETDVIQEFVDYATKQGSSNAGFYYSHITKLTNKNLEFLVQVNGGKPLKDLVGVEGFGMIGVVEQKAAAVIQKGMNDGLPYKYIYKLVKQEVEKLCLILNPGTLITLN